MASRYRLECNEHRRNVLITQLNEREDVSPEPIFSEPPVKDTPANLIRTEITCRQDNHVLRHNIHVKHVEELLEEKRKEVEERMLQCDIKRAMLREKQDKIRDKVDRFKEFIDENEIKRRRAVDKFQSGFRENLEKTCDFKKSNKDNQVLIAKQGILKNKLSEIKKYEDFLLTVLDILPENYLEVHDSKLQSLIMRHSTLSETKANLLNYVVDITDILEKEKKTLRKCEEDGERIRLGIDSKLATEKIDLESYTDINSTSEEQLNKCRNDYRQRVGCVFRW